jgi:ATP-dependent helicase HrpB
VRLYPLEDFVRRPAHDVPEIARADLAPTVLILRAMGGEVPEWLDAPQAAALAHAEELLAQLAPTAELAREMARYPLHPRLARLIVEARRRGVAEDGCTVAALLSAGERLERRADHATRSDLLVLLEAEWEPRTAQVVRQIRRLVNPSRQSRKDENALLISVLAAFPDRVARRRQGAELQLAAGGPAQLAPSSTVTQAEFLVAVEAEDRRDQKAPLVRIASAIEPEWLIDLFPERARDASEVRWNKAAGRVEAVSALMFDRIAIEESRGVPEPEAAAALLAEKGIEAGLAKSEELDAWMERVRFAAQYAPMPEVSAEAALRAVAVGLKSLAELEAAAAGGLVRAAEAQMPMQSRRLLEEVAPERIRLPGGRQVRVHYEPGQPPWIESRLQDFFGMRQTPAVARGAVPVVVRLLAPNNRPVQMTTDLAGFWERLYPQLRRELGRRYPKHKWPENPV